MSAESSKLLIGAMTALVGATVAATPVRAENPPPHPVVVAENTVVKKKVEKKAIKLSPAARAKLNSTNRATGAEMWTQAGWAQGSNNTKTNPAGNVQKTIQQ